MDEAKAIKLGGQIIRAEDCDYSSYWRLGLCCPSCGEPVHLKLGSNRPHFAHFPTVKGKKFEFCPMRHRSEGSLGYTNRVATDKNQRLKTFQRHFLSMIIPSFDKSFLNSWILFKNDNIDNFIIQTESIENNFTPNQQQIKQNVINLFCFDTVRNLGALNAVYSQLGMDSKNFAYIKSIVREVLDYLRLESSRDYLSYIVIRTIEIEVLRDDFDFNNLFNQVSHIHKALLFNLASIDWIYATDSAYTKIKEDEIINALFGDSDD